MIPCLLADIDLRRRWHRATAQTRELVTGLLNSPAVVGEMLARCSEASQLEELLWDRLDSVLLSEDDQRDDFRVTVAVGLLTVFDVELVADILISEAASGRSCD